MKKNIFSSIVVAIVLVMALSGCKAPTDIAYFQDMTDTQSAAVQQIQDIRVKPMDKLVVLVKSKDDELSQMLSLQPGTQSSSQGTRNQFAYTVNYDGCIDMPLLGLVKVVGLTRPEVAAYIKGQLVAKGIVLDPVVTVEFQGVCYSVLGEVRSPGSYEFERDRVTILEALAKAGDLQITGERAKVSVIRREGNEEKHYFVNLIDAKSLYQSPVFYLQQDDVVYVEPNAKRMRESRPNGNTFNTASFWIGMVSMVASLTSIVVNLAK